MTDIPSISSGGHTPEPAPWCRDALFLVTIFGDGECAILVRGWSALCAKFVDVHVFQPDQEERDQLMAILTDWEEWEIESDGVPYHLSLSYEDGGVSVTRITEDSTGHADLLAALERVKQILTVPAAEYVPAIPDAWDVIDAALAKARAS